MSGCPIDLSDYNADCSFIFDGRRLTAIPDGAETMSQDTDQDEHFS